MRNKKLWLLLLVLAVLVGLAIIAGGLIIYTLNAPPSVAAETVLEVPLGGTILETPASDPWTLLFASRAIDLWALRSDLESAKRDDRISAMFVDITPLATSWAQIEELRQLLKDFRESGKPVHAFLSVDLVTERELYLASAADSIAMNPTSGFLVDGLMTEVVFMKRTMDKLGVKPNFIQFKEYKSAETYTRQEMTPEIRTMLTGVLQDIQDRFTVSIAEDRGIDPATVRSLIDQGLFPATVGLDSGLVDRLAYRHEAQEALKSENGDREYQGMSLRAYEEARPSADRGRARAKVAYVGAQGMIVTGKSEGFSGLLGSVTMTSTLRSLREDSSIDGVILRVDSPGGSAVASDMIWEEVTQLEKAGKPVVVSMSGTAASGGYYLSMSARRIVAQPSTITGSIGVIFGKFDLSGLYNWLGMDIERIKLAPNSDFLSLTASLSDQQEEQVRSWMSQIYLGFVTKAAEGRNQEIDTLEAKARGRIYTGSQAVEAGLVDSLGGIGQAISEMKQALNLSESDSIRLELYPKPKSFLETLTSGDLLDLKAPAMLDQLVEEFRILERPAVWLLAPEIRVE
jgi:protease-4